MPKLTKTIVDKTGPGACDQWVWDTELKGFGIRVQPTGRKTYVTRYRTQKGKQRKQTIARCSDMPPEKARDLARKVFAAVAEGQDPIVDREKAREGHTMAQLRDQYMSEHARPYKKPSSAEDDERNWKIHVIPHFKKKTVQELTKADIVSLHAKMSATPAAANACLALLSKALNLAEDWGWRAPNSNPCRKLKKYKIREVELILSPEQIRALSQTLDEMVHERSIPAPLATLIRLLMLTGCRLNEIMSARREWVDDVRGLLLLPDSKVGQRRIVLSPVALAIIEDIPKDQKWLISGRNPDRHLTSPYGAWVRIKERAKLPKALRFHDLRHTAGSLGHAAGLSQKQIAIMLGHRQLSTTERYLHGNRGDNAMVMDTLASVIAQNWTQASAQTS